MGPDYVYGVELYAEYGGVYGCKGDEGRVWKADFGGEILIAAGVVCIVDSI